MAIPSGKLMRFVVGNAAAWCANGRTPSAMMVGESYFEAGALELREKLKRRCLLMAALTLACLTAMAHAADACRKVTLEGEVKAGQEWEAAIGDGWMFRVLPIAPSRAGYTGWDLVVDRDQPAGFPDALYLATPPYRSINEREIGTTFGLRAQDAIGWNPRSFRFLVDPASFREAQPIYLAKLNGSEAAADPNALSRLMELQKHAAQGEFRIVDAHIIPGVADPAPYAQRWAAAAARMQHEEEATGAASPLGALTWMRFRVTLWLPAHWSLPPILHATQSPCGR
jgi:hypothetical protein